MIVNAAAESHVEKSIDEGASRVRHDERRGHADPARRDPRGAGRALHPLLLQRGVRHRRVRARWTRSTRSTRAARTRRRRPGPTASRTRTTSRTGCRSSIVRPFNNYGPRQHPEKVVPRFITQALAGRAADDPRRRPREPRLALRRRRRRGDRGDHRRADRDVAGEVLNVATGIDISVDGHRGLRCSTRSASRRR